MGLFSKYTEGYKAEEQPKVVPPTTESTAPTVPVEPVVTAPAVAKPSWMADDDYNEALTRYSPEEINKIYDGYDPKSAEPFYQTLYKMNARKPKQVSEKSIKARRSLAGVSDALSLMVRGISAGSGAHISKQTGPTSMETENKNIQRLRDVYKVDQDRYDAGLFDNSMRDVELGRAEHGRKRVDLNTTLRDLRNRKYADKKLEREFDYKTAIADQNNAFKEREASERERHNKASEGISYTKAKADTAKDVDGATTPRGYVDIVDTNGGKSYRISEKNFDIALPQMFDFIKAQILEEDKNKRYNDLRIKPDKTLSVSEKAFIVKQYITQNPDALAILGMNAYQTTNDSNLIIKKPKPKEEENPIVMESKPTYNGPLRYIQELSKEENNAIVDMKTNREVAEYLMGQNWKEQEVTDIFKKNKAIRR